MGCRILYDSEEKMAAFYCSTSEVAFGPVFYEDPKGDWTAAEEAEFFMRWLPRDPREFTPDALEEYLVRFRAAKPKECGWISCRCPGWGKRDRRPATAYDFNGEPNKAHADGFCSEDCRDAAGEDAYDRNVEAFYGASTPQTVAEQVAAAIKREGQG